MTTATRILLGLALAGAAAPVQAQYPIDPPAPMPLAKLGFPPFREARMGNGLEIVLVANHRLPIVSLQLSIPTGSVHDPAGKRGVAEMVSDLITKGTATRSADEIAAAIEGVGGSLSASVGDDFFTLSSTVLTDGSELAFELMGDVLLNAAFPESEVELTRRRLLSALEVERSSPEALADRYFAAALYGQHPYGLRQSTASLEAITPADIRAFAATNLRPDGALLVVAGDITLEQVRQLVDRHLGAWRGKVPARSYGSPPLPKPSEILLVHRPGSEQANIVVGNLGLRPGANEYYAATVANKVLGGGADSRLFLILREQKGWTYGAYSQLVRLYDVGSFEATAEVRTAVADSALTEMLTQLKRIRTNAVPDSELVSAKGYLTGVFPLTIETPQQIASQVASQKRLGLGNDYLERYRDRIAAVTAPQVQAAAAAVIRPDSAVVVVVGDGAALYERLRAILPVRIVDTDGKPLAPDALAAPAAAATFDAAQLTPRRDSLQVMIQGNPMGAQTLEVTTEGDAIVVVERTTIPLMGMTQETRMVLDGGTLALRSVDQTGQVGPQAAETHLVVADGRITGRAQTPQPGGQAKVTDVDTVFAAGTLESNQLSAVVPALPLADGAAFTLNVLSGSDASLKPYQLRVQAGAPVTVPAGTFEVFKVSLTGGPVPLVLYVTQATPRRTVRIEVVGQPFVLELVQ
jgi:predicted Zn-dependent peptidase